MWSGSGELGRRLLLGLFLWCSILVAPDALSWAV
jgi:hypothetical protein